MGRIDEVWMCRAEVSGELVQSVVSNKDTGRDVQHAVFSIEVLNGGAAAGRVTIAKYNLKVAVQKLKNTIIHSSISCLPIQPVLGAGSCPLRPESGSEVRSRAIVIDEPIATTRVIRTCSSTAAAVIARRAACLRMSARVLPAAETQGPRPPPRLSRTRCKAAKAMKMCHLQGVHRE